MTSDSQRLDELRLRIRRIWNALPVPRLPQWLKTDREFKYFFPHVAGKHWLDVDLGNNTLASECWIHWAEPFEAVVYYLGSYLIRCCELIPRNEPVSNSSLIGVLLQMNYILKEMPLENTDIAQCMRDVLTYINDAAPTYEWEIAPIIQEATQQALATFSTRWAAQPDKGEDRKRHGPRKSG